jgi:hypothetical protein
MVFQEDMRAVDKHVERLQRLGWQRWWRQLPEQTREHMIVSAQECYGILHMAKYSLLVGVDIKDRLPGTGTWPQILAKSRLTTHVRVSLKKGRTPNMCLGGPAGHDTYIRISVGK